MSLPLRIVLVGLLAVVPSACDSDVEQDDDDFGERSSSSSGEGPSSSSGGGPSGSPGGVRLPPANAGLDYQLGAPYPPPPGVGIVARDHGVDPAVGLYNVCYVNGFQTQPEARDFWFDEHPELLLRDAGGQPVEDPDWEGEYFLDVGTAAKRDALLEVELPWLRECRERGFDAVEIDNLDTFTRSEGLLEADQAVAFMHMLAESAHGLGLAFGQKNSTELVARRDELGTDFAVAEECSHWDECEAYTEGYGDAVLMIEYDRPSFVKGCAAHPGHSIVLRDLELVGPGSPAYLFDGC